MRSQSGSQNVFPGSPSTTVHPIGGDIGGLADTQDVMTDEHAIGEGVAERWVSTGRMASTGLRLFCVGPNLAPFLKPSTGYRDAAKSLGTRVSISSLFVPPPAKQKAIPRTSLIAWRISSPVSYSS